MYGEICDHFPQKLTCSFSQKHGGPVFSKSSFEPNDVVLLLDLLNNFLPAFQQKTVVTVCKSNTKCVLSMLSPSLFTTFVVLPRPRPIPRGRHLQSCLRFPFLDRESPYILPQTGPLYPTPHHQHLIHSLGQIYGYISMC